MSFQMPPALAGDNGEISPDADGAKNFAMVTGGLALAGIATAVAANLAGSVLGAAGQDSPEFMEVN